MDGQASGHARLEIVCMSDTVGDGAETHRQKLMVSIANMTYCTAGHPCIVMPSRVDTMRPRLVHAQFALTNALSEH